MMKFLKQFKEIIAVLIVLAITFGAGYYAGNSAFKQKSVVEKDSNSFDLKMPFEVERSVVTVDEIEAKLYEIGELSTVSGEYKCTFGKDETRYWLDKIPIFGTTNSIKVTCDGIVKVGYDIADFNIKVDGDKIYISIPEPKLHDNYVIWDSVMCQESNNIFNPIEFSQYQEIIEEIEKKGLEEVDSKGLYQKAEDNVKVLIKAFLSDFTGYEVVFM